MLPIALLTLGKSMKFLLFALTIVTSFGAQALSFESSYELNKTVIGEYYFKNKFKVGIESANWNYNETVDGKEFMNNTGVLSGVSFSYQNMTTSHLYFWGYNFRYLSSDNTVYQGGTQGGESLTMLMENKITEHEFLFGWNLLESDKWNIYLKPYFGLSFRRLENPKNGYIGSYTRESQYTTLPLGTEVVFNINDESTISFNATYNALLGASTTSRLSEVDSAYSDTVNRQPDGYGYKVSSSYTHYLGNQSLIISAYHRVWSFEDSEEDVALDYGFGYGIVVVEPKNVTDMTGINLAIGF
jgi:hypothetical protein